MQEIENLGLRLLNIPPAVDSASDQKLDGGKAWEWAIVYITDYSWIIL